MTLRAPDLLHIGDNVSIGNAVNFENARVQRGFLHLGRITLERRRLRQLIRHHGRQYATSKHWATSKASPR
jgi:hypothetical protein